MIDGGLNRMVESGMEWPPNAVEFRNLCLPSADDYGLVSESVAFQMAIGNRSDKAPEVIYTLRQMGSEAYNLKHEKEKDAVARWEKWYSQTLEDVAHGIEIPEPELQIEKTEVKASPDSNKVITARDEINNLFN